MAWLQVRCGYVLEQPMLEVAQAALRINVAKEGRRLSRSASRELEALLG